MTENTLSTANLTAPEQRARLLKLLAQKERETKFAPLSFSQERFWLQEQLAPGSINSLSLTVRIRGDLNVPVLEQSLSEIVRRHESLRTSVVAERGQPLQVIKPPQPFQLPVITVDHFAATSREAEARRISSTELSRPFDIVHGPLFRATLVRLEATDHVLILITQHLISDAWSLSILIQELGVLYEAFSKGRPSPLPDLPIQYADFARWQREKMQGEALEHELAYWVQQIGDCDPELDIPTDRPRALASTTSGAREPTTIPHDLCEQLKVLAQQEGCTLFMVLLTGLQVLLHRYTGQKDIGVYTLVANRTINAVEKLIGLFLNTLPLRTRLGKNPTFAEVLHQVRQVTLDAYDHQTIPFQKLLEALQAQAGAKRAPLFQVLLLLQNVPNPVIQLSDLACERFVREMDFQAGMELALSLVETEAGLSGWIEYQTDLYEVTTIRRILAQYQTLLAGIVENPWQHLADLPLMTAGEQQQILIDWNNTATDYPSVGCIQAVFETQVTWTPDAIAVTAGDQHLTYQELNHQANRLAHYLSQYAVGPEILIGLCLERSPEMIIGLLGILKTGAAYVPLDPTYPTERLRFMRQDSQARVLLTQQHLRDQLGAEEQSARCQVVCLDTEWSLITQEPVTNPVSLATADNAAYVIYTSGSTGNPKGVVGTHRAALNRFAWMWQTYPFAAGEVCCQKTALSFVDSVWEIFGPLLKGQRLVLIPDDVVKDIPALVRVLAEHHVTRLVLVPALLRVLLDVYPRLATQVPALKIVTASGEALPLDLAQQHLAAIPDSTLLNLYGSSEVAADVTWYDAGWITHDLSTLPIGKPIANTQAYILDDYLNLAPIGIVGELYIGGVGLARGYWNRPELTADRFIPNTFDPQAGSRLYRTGDRARYSPDGNLEYAGRADYQVKVRGFRIELGEIEAALRQHPAVREAVVAVYSPDAQQANRQLVAYLVPQPSSLETSELRSFLHATLPDYMIPATFVILDALPLTPSGKVNRRALPPPDLERPAPGQAYVAPRTFLEQELARIWCAVLNREQMGIYDDFFELGGHSLLGTQIISRVKQELHVELPLRALFDEPTVAGLATLIAVSQPLASPVAAPQDLAEQMSIDVDQLSDNEVDTLLKNLFA